VSRSQDGDISPLPAGRGQPLGEMGRLTLFLLSSSRRHRLATLRPRCGGNSLLAGPPARVADKRAPYAFLVISVLAVGASACFMFWSVFSFLFCTAVFFRMFRHHNPPLIFNKPLTVVTISLNLLFMKGSLCILTRAFSSFSFTIKNRVHFSS
jgi:hypothetical protein